MGIKHRVLFISGFRKELLALNGVVKKISLEIETFVKCGYTVDYVEFKGGKVFLNHNGKLDYLCDEGKTFYNTMHSVFKRLDSKCAVNYDLYYYRYEHFCFSMISFFRKSKEENKNLKIVGELPTFMKKWSPGSSFRTKLKFIVKRFLDNNFEKYIDYMVTFSDHEKIFGIKTIRIENFVDIEKVFIKKQIDNKKIDLLALAQITPSHGFDRVIKGMSFYIKTRKSKPKIFLHVVGNGNHKQDLVELTNKLQLNEYVKFYGALGGEELDHIFDIADLGIGSLAFFRKGTSKGSELKVREYTARGLPFIYSAVEPQLRGVDFALKVPFDESDINIEDIEDFYNSLCHDSNLLSKMRDFAEREFTCKKQFDLILSTVFDNEF